MSTGPPITVGPPPTLNMPPGALAVGPTVGQPNQMPQSAHINPAFYPGSQPIQQTPQFQQALGQPGSDLYNRPPPSSDPYSRPPPSGSYGDGRSDRCATICMLRQMFFKHANSMRIFG